MDYTVPSTDKREQLSYKFYSDLDRTVVLLFVSLIALMALLLTAGYQRPDRWLTFFMNGSILSLGLNLLVHPLGRYLHFQSLSRHRSQDRVVTFLRAAQLVLFTVSVVCLMGTAFSLLHFFLKSPGVQSRSTQGPSRRCNPEEPANQLALLG